MCKGCSWSFLGASRDATGSLKGAQLEFLGASRQGLLLEILGPRGVQLDVFRRLKGGSIENFWSFKGCCWKYRRDIGGFIGASRGYAVRCLGGGGCSSRFWKNVRSPNQTRYGQDSMCVL